VRIHPILDDAFVPRFFLEYVVYHELCHAALPSVVGADGRLRHHTAEFHALERQFPRYDEAVAWQTQNLDRLLRAWCRGKPVGKPRRKVAEVVRDMIQGELF
jgi:predicted SprT family Zn-dependent metalloprotease